MKPFSDIRIIACFAAHDDDNYIDLVLKDLSKYTNEIYVNLNDATEKIKNSVLEHRNVVKTIQTTNDNRRWSQGKVRDDTIRMLDDVKPDIVLFPDSDEIYPDNLMNQLQKFWENEEYKTFWFRLLYLWDDEKHFRNDRLFKSIHHVRIYKWQLGITYLPKYAGYACPTNYCFLEKNTRYHSDLPILHYGYMKEEDRIRKYKRANENYNKGTKYRKNIDRGKIIREVPKELMNI